MDLILHGYCGLYCGACPILLNTKAETGTERCYGCKSGQPTGYCAICSIKACAARKDIEFCHACSDLDTCELIRKFVDDTKWPYQHGVLKNLEMIRRDGLAKWLDGQDERWRCRNCGQSHSWWDEICPQCGQVVASYRVDE